MVALINFVFMTSLLGVDAGGSKAPVAHHQSEERRKAARIAMPPS